jgi:hypothetical protein
MAKKMSISPKNKDLLINRANGCCEYCKSPSNFSSELFSVEHIVPRSLNGSDDFENLAFACIGCNIFKSNKVTGIDPISQKTVELFNPRTMVWDEYFIWDLKFTTLIGLTDISRATIQALKLNRTPLVNLRRALVAIGVHP